MKKKQKKYIFGIIFLILAGIALFVFFCFRKKQASEISSLPVSSIVDDSNDATNQTNDIVSNEKHFSFRVSEKRLIQERFDYFPEKLIKRNNFPKNWKISNFLNYFFKDWKKHYNISEQKLREPLKKHNYIYFQPKKKILLRKGKQSFTLKDLEKLNIFSSYLKISGANLSTLIEVIHEEGNDWSEVEKYIENNFKEQKIRSVTRKIRDSILFF